MFCSLLKKSTMVLMVALAILAIVGSLAACGGSTSTPQATATETAAPPQTGTAPPTTGTATPAPSGTTQISKVPSPVELTGAGATFPYPLYSKWFDVYKQSVDPNVTINYQSIGSGAGKQQITQKTVDFGASDSFMSDAELAKAPGILHIPTVAGSVAVIYNVQGVDTGLKLTPDAISGIYLGKITKWNDPTIADANPGLTLPDTDISVAHRSDGSGTTNIFTNYLSAVSADWKSSVGAGTSVNWPVGIGAKGNEGVAGQVQQLPDSIGYAELAYAQQNKLTYAFVQNQAGDFVEPTIESTEAAVSASAATIPEDLRATIVNAPGAGSYPIAGFTWILVYQEQTDQLKGQALANFLWWALHDGGQYATGLQYAPLPDNVAKLAAEKVQSITFQGKPILTGQ